jgi:SAM-dependent methyltransferase
MDRLPDSLTPGNIKDNLPLYALLQQQMESSQEESTYQSGAPFPKHILAIPPAAGHFDELRRRGRNLFGKGWLFLRPYVIDRAVLFIDGEEVLTCQKDDRPDVRHACTWARESQPFSFSFAVDAESVEEFSRFDVLGFARGRPVARMSTFYFPKLGKDIFPVPPPELALRVSGVKGDLFLLQGLKMFTDLADAMTLSGIEKRDFLLDWGCGCGRVLRWFLLSEAAGYVQIEKASTDVSVPPLGCDIDAEAIQWCRDNLLGRFEVVPFDPPTPLPSEVYDIVIACSVLTHLDRDRQHAWLAEVHRWLARGGWFIASTNAEFAFRSKHPDLAHVGWRKWLEKYCAWLCRPPLLRTILDGMPDPNMRWVIPEDTYRMVFQPRSFTEKLCAEYFDVVRYIECGLDGFQDLIICRKR